MTPNHLSFAAQALRYFDRPHDDVLRTSLDVAAAWRGEAMRCRSDWIVRLSSVQVGELDRARAAVRARGLDLAAVRREDFPLPTLGTAAAAWAEELSDWVLEQVTGERDVAVALYRLQFELLGSPGAREVHREWGRSLRALGDRVLAHSTTLTPEIDIRLIVAALDGLRLTALSADDGETDWLRPAVRRQLRALLG